MSRQAKRVLVVASDVTDGEQLEAALQDRVARTRAEVLVVAPSADSPLRLWHSDERDADRQADDRLTTCVEQLRLSGFDADGIIGDCNPMLAIANSDFLSSSSESPATSFRRQREP